MGIDAGPPRLRLVDPRFSHTARHAGWQFRIPAENCLATDPARQGSQAGGEILRPRGVGSGAQRLGRRPQSILQAAVGVDGGRGFGSSHRLRQYRQSTAGPRRGSTSRDWCPAGYWRQPRPRDPATADRRDSAGGRRRAAGIAIGAVGTCAAAQDDRRRSRHPSGDDLSTGLADFGVHKCCIRRDGCVLCVDSRRSLDKSGRQSGAEEGQPFYRQWRYAFVAGPRIAGYAGWLVPDPVGRRRAFSPDASKSHEDRYGLYRHQRGPGANRWVRRRRAAHGVVLGGSRSASCDSRRLLGLHLPEWLVQRGHFPDVTYCPGLRATKG